MSEIFLILIKYFLSGLAIVVAFLQFFFLMIKFGDYMDIMKEKYKYKPLYICFSERHPKISKIIGIVFGATVMLILLTAIGASFWEQR